LAAANGLWNSYAPQITTLRDRLVKLGVWLERSVRRVVVHVPAAFPWRREWGQLAIALGATP
jgi:hypothetical protein